MNGRPTIYSKEVEDNFIIDLLVERYDDFEILWYHWPRDGSTTEVHFAEILGGSEEQDYEPIIIMYNEKGEICCMISRAHWKYRFFSEKEEENPIIPPEILFEGQLHGPMIRAEINEDRFLRKLLGLTTTSGFPERVVNRDEIPPQFRTGEGHGMNVFRIIVDDPFDVASKFHAFYCTQA